MRDFFLLADGILGVASCGRCCSGLLAFSGDGTELGALADRIVPLPRVSKPGPVYGYNPNPPIPEGIRRPVSKTVLHQNRRHSAPQQSSTDVSAPKPLFPFTQWAGLAHTYQGEDAKGCRCCRMSPGGAACILQLHHHLESRQVLCSLGAAILMAMILPSWRTTRMHAKWAVRKCWRM